MVLRTLLVHLRRLIRLRLAAAGVNLVSRVLNNLAKLSDFAASPAVVVHVSGNPSGHRARAAREMDEGDSSALGARTAKFLLPPAASSLQLRPSQTPPAQSTSTPLSVTSPIASAG